MEYRVNVQPRASRDLEGLPAHVARRVLAKIDGMRHDLAGDVKHLRNFGIGYRLRVGDYRVLFDLVGDTIFVRRVLPRGSAYD